MLVYILWPALQYSSLERYFYDALLRLTLPVAEESRIIIVDIDERSLEKLGTWPWPRSTVAKLANELTERQKVALLGLDIVFPQSKPDDGELHAALDRANVVMSQALDFSPHSNNRVGMLSGSVMLQGRELAPSANGFIANAPKLLPKYGGVGHISPIVDEDGRVRRLYPIACVDGTCTFIFALRLYVQLVSSNAHNVKAAYAKRGTQLHIDLGNFDLLNLPLDQERALMVPYRVAAGGFQVMSAIDVMQADRSLPELDKAIVLIGSSALGIGDRVATPLLNLSPGVEVHAQLLAALLDRRFIQPVTATSNIFLLLAAAVVFSWLVWPRRNRYVVMLWPLVMLLLLVAALSWFFLYEDQLLPLSPLPFMVLIISAYSLLAENFSLSGRMRRLTSRLDRFLPSVLVGRFLKGDNLKPATELRIMTVLIADIRDFTSASQGKTPEQIAEFAQKCFEVLAAEVARYQGTIERYSGDGLVAMWGVPRTDLTPEKQMTNLLVFPVVGNGSSDINIDHAPYAVQAVSAAIAMQQGIHSLSEWFIEKQYGQRQLCVGLNTGPMAVGVFGGESHLTWSAQGQAFNITSRIESLTRDLGTNILMGEATALLLNQRCVRYLGAHTVKGVSEPVAVYAPNGI
jgi:adenylate cyclase